MPEKAIYCLGVGHLDSGCQVFVRIVSRCLGVWMSVTGVCFHLRQSEMSGVCHRCPSCHRYQIFVSRCLSQVLGVRMQMFCTLEVSRCHNLLLRQFQVSGVSHRFLRCLSELSQVSGVRKDCIQVFCTLEVSRCQVLVTISFSGNRRC